MAEIQEGWYDMQLVMSKDEHGDDTWFIWDENSNGKPFLKGRMEIQQEPHVGTRRSIMLYLTDAAFPSTEKALRKMGWVGNDLDEIDGEDLSRLVRGKIVVDHFTGRDGDEVRTEKVDAIGSAGGGALKSRKNFSKAAKRAMAARLRGMSSGRPPANAGGFKPAGPNDDLPF